MKTSILFALGGILLLGCAVGVTPVDFPVTKTESFQFPEGQERIYSWLSAKDDASIAKHAWGIWAGLTQPSGQSYKGQPLYVFETWMGVGELSAASATGTRSAGCGMPRYGKTKLQRPKQFGHVEKLGAPVDTQYTILETVSYSPMAACFATSNLLFNKSVLDSFSVAGDIGRVPDFPVRSIITKPTYYVTKAQTGLVRVPAWTKTPDPAKAFGNATWNNYIYVDLENTQPPGKALVPTGENPTEAQVRAATCNASDFIYYRLDYEAAKYLNEHQDVGGGPANQFHTGDVVLLVAMHVTTKEIKNWTWQTFFWVPDPANPGTPSSPEISAVMPSSVVGAARHYAASPAYSMVSPNQPVTGGSGEGCMPVIAYNPYLEAGFGPKVFQHPNTWMPDFQYGVQTNCMSCHSLATASGKLGYSTDQYIDMADKAFIGEVQLDFAWSIQGNMNADK